MAYIPGTKLFDENGSSYGIRQVDNKPRVSCMPYLFDIAEGNISGHTIFTKYGRIGSVNTAEFDVWEGGSGYIFPVTTGQIMNIKSTSVQDHLTGAGIRTVSIEYLNANNETNFETIDLLGTRSNPTVALDIRRVNRMFAASVGSGAAVGNISLYNIGTSRVFSVITSGNTQSRQLIYTVPSGKNLYITDVNVSAGAGGSTVKNNFVTFTNRATVNPSSGIVSTIFYPYNEIGVMNGAFHLELQAPTKIPQTADLKMSVISDYAGDAVCTAAIRGWLENI
jgi:hypothetical protein